MATAGTVTLGGIRIQVQQRADMVNSNFISTPEWNSYINNSYKELYDLLISAYGNNYYVAPALQFQTDGSTFLYPLPNGTLYSNAPAFYKLLGVDLALATSLDSFVAIQNFNFSDRNRYAVPNFQSFYGVTNLRYRLQGNSLWLTPIPAAGQTIQIWYIPEPTSLQTYFIGSTTSSSTTVTTTDTSTLSVGMQLNNAAIPAGTKINSIVTNTSMVISAAATATSASTYIQAWNDNTALDGISGWEEYIIVDAAIKVKDKEESDVSVLEKSKLDMKVRLEAMAEARDAANPARVSDTQYNDFWGSGSDYGSGAF